MPDGGTTRRQVTILRLPDVRAPLLGLSIAHEHRTHPAEPGLATANNLTIGFDVAVPPG